jgi:hypothetical protein
MLWGSGGIVCGRSATMFQWMLSGGATPLGLVDREGPLTQGSSFVATLGFVAESLWDSGI